MNNTVNEIEKLPLYLSADDLEKLLPMSRAGVYNTMHSESFPLVRIGKRMMTPRDDFFAWMKDHIKK